MQILVGISNSSLTDLEHARLTILCNSDCAIATVALAEIDSASAIAVAGEKIVHTAARSSELTFSARHGTLIVSAANFQFETKEAVFLVATTHSGSHFESLPEASFTVTNVLRQRAKGNTNPHYIGSLLLFAKNDSVRINLECSLENYVKGVLQSEVPESYHLEAIKAQAVAARTYGLHPRVSHTPDHANVCDSYLCCQYFAGSNFELAGKYKSAIEETKNEILTFEGHPILALFSSNAGGHTEDYENCFSDNYSNNLKNESFPGTALPYLRGVPEGLLPDAKSSGTEQSLRKIWNDESLVTCDSWSSQFRWHVLLSADHLEGHMHHVVETMMIDKQFAPFIVAPKGAQFGHIKGFKANRRGVSGTIIELEIATTTGNWKIRKELVIRSIFKNADAKLQRLKSAKFYLDEKHDSLGLLTEIQIFGMGWGHGVGMQQTGAQGLALSGKSYKQILEHYFQGASVSKA